MEYSDKQLAIIDIAEKLFSEKGYEGTSVRDIAEMAGINVAMISYYFGSKEKLMQALFKERTKEMLVRMESVLNEK
jgi:AcrR family transcriptional regulator